MGRPRTKNRHLPKYVTVIHGAYWYAAPKQKRVRICDKGDDAALYKFLLERATPAGPAVTMLDLFDRYESEVAAWNTMRRQEADLAALRARVAEAERQFRALVFNTHTSHDLAKAKEDAIKWLTPSAGGVHTPAPTCKECGQFLDSRGKCRVPEHNV